MQRLVRSVGSAPNTGASLHGRSRNMIFQFQYFNINFKSTSKIVLATCLKIVQTVLMYSYSATVTVDSDMLMLMANGVFHY